MNIETEHKYIIKMPSQKLLYSLPSSKIEQTYITSDGEDGVTERVRRREYDDRIVYTHTKKRRVSDMSHEEYEDEITAEEYGALLTRKCADTVTLYKTRYLLTYMGQTFELDVYTFWRNIAVMELEVGKESDAVALPPDIDVIREVTGERRFSNAALSRSVPDESEILAD